MTRNGSPAVSTTAKTETTCSCTTAAAARASRRNRRRAAPQLARCGESTLIATLRCSAGSNALSTTPIPPRPITPLTSYVPSRPSESGQSDGASAPRVSSIPDDGLGSDSYGSVGSAPEVLADRADPGLAVGHVVEGRAALGAVLEVLFQSRDLVGRQAVLGEQPEAAGITGIQPDGHDRPR